MKLATVEVVVVVVVVVDDDDDDDDDVAVQVVAPLIRSNLWCCGWFRWVLTVRNG